MSTLTHNRNKTVKILFVQFMIFIVLVMVSDIILWMFFPISINTESCERLVTQNLPGLKNNIVYKCGKYGLRSLSTIDYVKPDNMIRVLCVGASTTDQATQETQDTWSGILETRLHEHYGDLDLKIQTMAFGKGAIRASDNAFWIKETFDNIEPDIVITLLGINDLAWNGGENYEYSSIEDIFSRKVEKSDGRIEHICKKYSQIYRRIISMKRNLRIKKRLKKGESVEWHSSKLPNLRNKYQNYPYIEDLIRDPDPINEFSDAINWMITFLKKRKVRMILLGQPVLWKESFDPDEFNSLWFPIITSTGPVRPSGAWLKKEMNRYNSVQQSIASQSSINYINLDGKIPKTIGYYFDDCHYTDLGSKALADNILPVLVHTINDIVNMKGLPPMKSPLSKEHK